MYYHRSPRPIVIKSKLFTRYVSQNFLYKTGDEGTITSPNYPERVGDEGNITSPNYSWGHMGSIVSMIHFT